MAVIVFWSRVTDRVWVAEMSAVERSFSSLWVAGSGGLDASVVIGPLSCSLLDSSIVSNVGLHWGILTVSRTEPLVCVCACVCWQPPDVVSQCFKRLIAIWRPHLWVNGFAFQMSDLGGRARRPSDETMIVFQEKWNEGKERRKSAKGDDDCFPLLAWLILLTEEIGRLSRSADRSLFSGKIANTIGSLSLHLSIAFSVFSSRVFHLSICHLVSVMFSQIIAFHWQ